MNWKNNKFAFYTRICAIILVMNLFVMQTIYAQNTGLNFQGVARNPSGVILASQNISLRFSIINTSASGTAEYIETRIVATNGQGVFSLVIGDTSASVQLGTFASINWKIIPKFLKVELDPNAGNNFFTMGVTQLQTVPYSNYSQYAASAGSIDATNISGLIPVARGGTGVSDLNSLKKNLELYNVDNIKDTAKPISNLTKVALELKENIENKSNKIDLGGVLSSDELYPTQKAVKNYVDTSIHKIENITSINGLKYSTQHLVISNQGIMPTVISTDSVHSINLPIASTPLVTAGLITKVDYDQFYNKSDFSGNYNDLSNLPIIPAKQIQSNWIELDSTRVDYIKNKPNLSLVSKTGSYLDLYDQPTINDLAAVPNGRTITINGFTQDLSVDRNWVVNPVIGSVSMNTDVKDILSIANGGTGSSTKNFVDLENKQTINGAKIFSNSIAIGAESSEDNAIVDMISNSKGFLPPRLTTIQRDGILNPPIGLTIFNVDRNCLEWWIGTIWYNACGNASVSTTTNGTASVTILDCASGTANGVNGGSYDIGIPVTSGNSWQVLNLKVNSIGNYNFTTSANGITYSAVGQFYESDVLAGNKAIYLTASGTAQNAGTFTYKLSTLPSCTFTNNVNTTSSNGSSIINAWDNTNTEYGTLIQGNPISEVRQKIKAFVTQSGTYKILASQNGLSFMGEGDFPTANALYDVILTATGIPTNAGTFTFTTNTDPAKSFTRTVISPSSNGTAVINNYIESSNSEGLLTASNQIISNTVTQTLTLNVLVPGTYSITAISNGINFSGSGIITGTGTQTIQLIASGTPINNTNTIFNLNTRPSLSFERPVLVNPTSGGTSIVTSWTNESSFGNMTVGNIVNYVTNTVTAFVDKIGTYAISATNNGVQFYASGSFTSRGYQKVVLNASGNPTTIGVNNFILNVSNPISFSRMVNANPSTNGTAIINSWSGGISTGNLFVNKEVSGFTFSINADVLRVGTYDIDVISNGILFRATGIFTSTGTNVVSFIASGKPNVIANIRLNLNSLSNLYSSPLISINANPSSNGTSSVGSWSIGSQSGIGYAGEEVQNLTQELIANVLTVGTYNITTNVYGVTFFSSGTFSGTGSQTVKLTASGIPIKIANTLNTINTIPSKTFTVQYYSKSTNGTAVVSNWTNGTLSKSIYVGSSLYAVNYSVIANVTTIGTYNISIENNGILFSSIGSFSSTGSNTVILNATGLAAESGTYQFSLNTMPSTIFNVDVFSKTSNGTSVLKDLKFGTSTGTLYYGLVPTNVTKEIKVTVTKIGTYEIDTETATGVEFSASGTFTSLGEKTITLKASGIPTSHLYSVFTLSSIPNADGYTNSFTFDIKIPAIGTKLANMGGIIAYIYQPGDNGYDQFVPHGLIAAETDISKAIVWENDLTSSGTTSLDLGTGGANTSNIFSRSTVMNAAITSVMYTSGYKEYVYLDPEDWYLPSNDELYQLYVNRAKIGGFNERFYWTSSEVDNTMAVARDFVGGNLTFKIKTSLLALRPIRYF